MKKNIKCSPEVRERAARMINEARSEHPSQWAAVGSIAATIGCTPANPTQLGSPAQAQYGTVRWCEQEPIRALEREVKELRKANEILRLASAFFARAELDHRFKS